MYILKEITANSYVIDAVIADNGGLIIAINGTKDAKMVATNFLKRANKELRLGLKYCKVVSATGAKKGNNYIQGKQLAFVSDSQI